MKTIGIKQLGNFLVVATVIVASGFAISSCGIAQTVNGENKNIGIVVTETPILQEPTEIVREKLADNGWELEPQYVADIIIPNNSVSSGEVEVNFSST